MKSKLLWTNKAVSIECDKATEILNYHRTQISDGMWFLSSSFVWPILVMIEIDLPLTAFHIQMITCLVKHLIAISLSHVTIGHTQLYKCHRHESINDGTILGRWTQNDCIDIQIWRGMKKKPSAKRKLNRINMYKLYIQSITQLSNGIFQSWK